MTNLCELLNKKEEKKEGRTLLWVLAVIGAVAAIAGIAYAVYRYLTPNYLGEIFKAEMGLSFSAYLMQTRLVFARSLLQNGRCTVTQAAFASGFNSPAYFSERFKKEYGYPPYQEATIAAISPTTANPVKEL